VLFYKELDFGLSEIKNALSNESSRRETLATQRQLLLRRRDRLTRVLATLEQSLQCTEGESEMNEQEMFSALKPDEWNRALEPQNRHLKEKFAYEVKVSSEEEAERMNRAAREAQGFLLTMARHLRDGRSHGDDAVLATVEAHVHELNKTHATDARRYFKTVEMLAQDPFHRNAFEQTQTGLSSYLFASAYAYLQTT